MKIAIGSDHAGWEIKTSLMRLLKEKGYTVEDFGCDNGDACDYPDFGLPVAEAVSRGEYERGILICGAGIGMSLVANKVPRVRAALCLNPFMAKVSREHNDANILILPGRISSKKESAEMAIIFLETKFSGEERHARRLAKIKEIEKKYFKKLKEQS
jgi:RpiB/LacA/LacB family sugar-phosphate isomerase